MKTQRKEKRIILFLLIGVILMTVGFATYAGFLNIDGTVTVKSNKWSVGFDATSYAEATDSVSATSKSITTDSYTFAVELAKPNTFYEATVNVENAGTFIANVTKLEMEAKLGTATLTDAEKKYFEYVVIYEGQTYTSSTGEITLPIEPGESKPLTVKVRYLQPADSADLPTSDKTISVTGKLTYSIAE